MIALVISDRVASAWTNISIDSAMIISLIGQSDLNIAHGRARIRITRR